MRPIRIVQSVCVAVIMSVSMAPASAMTARATDECEGDGPCSCEISSGGGYCEITCEWPFYYPVCDSGPRCYCQVRIAQ